MKFLGKWVDPEWGNPITKELTCYSLTDKWILAQKLRIPKIQFAKHKKIKKKEDQSVDTVVLLRMGNKIPMEGVTGTKFRAEMNGRTIQRLPHPGIHILFWVSFHMEGETYDRVLLLPMDFQLLQHRFLKKLALFS